MCVKHFYYKMRKELLVIVNKYIDENQLPHLLLYGPPGTGKTSTILACARKLYTSAQFNSMVVYLSLNNSMSLYFIHIPYFIYKYLGIRIKCFR